MVEPVLFELNDEPINFTLNYEITVAETTDDNGVFDPTFDPTFG